MPEIKTLIEPIRERAHYLFFEWVFYFKMEQNKTLVYDDNVSLEIKEKLDGDLLLKMYYNSIYDNYICISLNEEQVMLLIDGMAEFLNTYGHGRE